jgi:hypothetical protein
LVPSPKFASPEKIESNFDRDVEEFLRTQYLVPLSLALLENPRVYL